MERHITAIQMSDLFFNYNNITDSIRDEAEIFADFFTHQDEHERQNFIETLVTDYLGRL